MQLIDTKPERVVVVTGSNTGVGKTILSAVLMQLALDAKVSLRVLKPFSTGGQDDAEVYAAIHGKGVCINDINPWHFALGISPMLAAREARAILPSLSDVGAWIRSAACGSGLTIIEGAGGVLTPLGEGFSIIDVGKDICGHFLVAVPNVLGAINQARLCYEVLGFSDVEKPTIVLMDPRMPDASTETNLGAVRELCNRSQVIRVPYLRGGNQIEIASEVYNFLKKSLEISGPSGRTLSVLCEVVGVDCLRLS